MASSPNKSNLLSEHFQAGQAVGGGRFLLKRLLGQGGMGVVWLAHDKLLRESVALKFLPSQVGFDPEAIAGLRRETLRARRLSHPNIVRVHDLVDQEGEPTFICMEFVEGANLHVLRSHHPSKVLRWDYLAPLLRQAAAALDYAHSEGIIHHDIKPANLILGNGDRLKLADFGLARVISSSLSRLSGPQPPANGVQTSGTIEYMSPQQADGGSPHVSDDIYALGATLYELLTSTPPFHRGDISYQIRNAVPEHPELRAAGLGLSNEIPPTVSAFVMACLAKDPNQRPPTARAILDWLDSSAASAGITAAPTPVATMASLATGQLSPDPASGNTPGERPWMREAPAPRRRWLALTAIAAAVLVTALLVRKAASPSSAAERNRDAAAVPGASNSQPTSPTAVPAPPLRQPGADGPDEGFISLFNGHDLTGWSGEPGVWYVKEGAITAWAAEEGIIRRQNSCLIWDGEVGDFELRLKFRQVDVIAAKPANSGVLYRARLLDGWQVRGYQADLNGNFTGSLLVLREDGLDPRADLGRAVRLTEDKGRILIKNTGVVADASKILQSIQKEGWNELTILAQGKHIVHHLNGALALEALDETHSPATRSGRLAFEMKRATLVQFKDIWLKKL